MSHAGYLLDTNALSEGTKRSPNAGYLAWLEETPHEQLYISCLVIGEGLRGSLPVTDPAKSAQLCQYWSDVKDVFASQTLAIDTETCAIWAEISALARQQGATTPYADSLIAAQAMQHDLTLVTRNTRDFARFRDLRVACPWS